MADLESTTLQTNSDMEPYPTGTPDGSMTYDTTNPDGAMNYDMTNPDGTMNYDMTNPDGTMNYDMTNPDGTMNYDMTNPDGTMNYDMTNPDGTMNYDTAYPDGTTPYYTTTQANIAPYGTLEDIAWQAHSNVWAYDYNGYFSDLLGNYGYAYADRVEMQQDGILAVVNIYGTDTGAGQRSVVLFDFMGEPVARYDLGSDTQFLFAPDAETGHFFYVPAGDQAAVQEVTLSNGTFAATSLFALDTAVASLDPVADFGAPAEEPLDLRIAAVMNTPDGGYLVAVEAEMLSNGGTFPRIIGLKLDAAGNLVSQTAIEGLVENGFQGSDGNIYLESRQFTDDGAGGQVENWVFQKVDLSGETPLVSTINGDEYYDARWELYGFETKLMINGELVDFADFAPNGVPLTGTQGIETEGAYAQADGSLIVHLFVFDDNDPVNNSYEHLVRFAADGTVLEEQSLPARYWSIDADDTGNNIYLQAPVADNGDFQILQLNFAGDTLPTVADGTVELSLNMNALYPNLPAGSIGFIESGTGNDSKIVLEVGAWDPATDEDADTHYLAVIDEQSGVVEFTLPVIGYLEELTLTKDGWIYFRQWNQDTQMEEYFRLDTHNTAAGLEMTDSYTFWNAVESHHWIPEYYINGQMFNFEHFSTDNFTVSAADRQAGSWYHENYSSDGYLESTLVVLHYWNEDLDAERTLLLLYGPDATSPNEFLFEVSLPTGSHLLNTFPDGFAYVEEVAGQPGEVFVKQAEYDTLNGFTLGTATLFGGNSLNLSDLYPATETTGLEVFVTNIAHTSDVTLVVSGAFDPVTDQDLASSHIAIVDNQTGQVLDTAVIDGAKPWNLWPHPVGDDVYLRQWLGWDDQSQQEIANYFKADLTSTPDSINLIGISEADFYAATGWQPPFEPPVEPPVENNDASYHMEASELGDGGIQVKLFLNSVVDINAVDLQFLYDEFNFDLVDLQLQPGWQGSLTDRHDGAIPTGGADIAISAANTVAADPYQPFAVLTFDKVNADSQFDISLQQAAVSSNQMAQDGIPPLPAYPEIGSSDSLVLDLNGPMPALLDLRNAQLNGNELSVEVWFNPQAGEEAGSFEWNLEVLDSSGALITQAASAATPNIDVVLSGGLSPTNNLEAGSFLFSGSGSVDAEILLTTITYQLDTPDPAGVTVALGNASVGLVQPDQTLLPVDVAADFAEAATGLTLDGIVSFWADQSKTVAGVEVVLHQGNEIDGYTTAASAVTNANGEYSFEQVSEGGYHLELSLADPSAADYQSVISAAEASTAARLAVGLIDNANISEYAKIAADIDQNGQISAADASMIARQAVGLVQLDGWVIAPELSASKLSELAQNPEHDSNDALLFDNSLQLNADTSQNYVAVLLGDIDGSAVSLLDDLNGAV